MIGVNSENRTWQFDTQYGKAERLFLLQQTVHIATTELSVTACCGLKEGLSWNICPLS